MLSIMTDFLLLMLAPNLTKVTAVVGLWGWSAVSLAVATLIMFYKCTR
jgi:competence protein ComGC